MNYAKLVSTIFQKRSFLCVGLDSDISKLPAHLPQNPRGVLEFNRKIIEATQDFCVAYKINTAFYEAMGAEGWAIMQETLHLIPDAHFKIADAKRGDIGNTSALYARAFFEQMNFDALTVAPYMGSDSVIPFLHYPDKWVILLALTSNEGSRDFQFQKIDDKWLFEQVIHKSQQWATSSQMMYVVGATQAEMLVHIRQIIPHHFLLVPGVGAQGGSLSAVAQYSLNQNAGVLVNASRSILYASSGEDFAEKAQEEARMIQAEMKVLLEKYGKVEI